MVRYQAVVEYDGTRYRGWQKQKDADNTIQGKLEAVLERIAGHPVEVQGSGRTDAGVHARGQVISFSLDQFHEAEELMDALNHYLPKDIGIRELEKAPQRFHARLNAVGKTYVYRIWNSPLPNVFGRKRMYTIEEPLDLAKMRQAAEYFLGSHDFAAFCAAKKKKKSTVRRIFQICVKEISPKKELVWEGQGDMPLQRTGAKACGREVQIWITGDGFLHRMVRIMAGTLVEAGLGKRAPEEVEGLLEQGIRADAGVTVPAKGLTLWEVYYESAMGSHE